MTFSSCGHELSQEDITATLVAPIDNEGKYIINNQSVRCDITFPKELSKYHEELFSIYKASDVNEQYKYFFSYKWEDNLLDLDNLSSGDYIIDLYIKCYASRGDFNSVLTKSYKWEIVYTKTTSDTE
jgi:hypothetical protein